eukprot:2678517-Prymnesium_polylepis.1
MPSAADAALTGRPRPPPIGLTSTRDSLASAKELSFAWMALGGAVVSDLALALRNVLSKKSMAAPRDEHMTPANMFGVLTCISAIVSLPIMLAAEGGSLGPAWRAATAQVAPASL